VVWIYSTQNPNETIEDIFTTKEDPAEIISYNKIDPTKYVVKINATKPFMLSFAESYDPLWVAYVNGEKIQSVPLYGVINGFWINQTSILEITIEYEPQRWFNYGCAVSLTTFLACIAYATYSWLKNKAIWKRTKSVTKNIKTKLSKKLRKKGNPFMSPLINMMGPYWGIIINLAISLIILGIITYCSLKWLPKSRHQCLPMIIFIATRALPLIMFFLRPQPI